MPLRQPITIAEVSTPRVLYIAGAARCGSTVFEEHLAHDGEVVALGELSYLWERGFGADHRCSCGERFSGCPFWHAVAGDHFTADQANRLSQLAAGVVRVRTVPAMLGHRPPPAGLDDYAEVVDGIYRRAAAVAGRPLVVDSSKYPQYGALAAMTDVPTTYLHMIRDSRATAFSWSKTSDTGRDSAPMGVRSPIEAARIWTKANIVAEAVGRGLRGCRVRYEDFVDEPDASVERVLGRARLVGPAPVVHSFSGNPARTRPGAALTPDRRWIERQPFVAFAQVTALTAPVLVRHGYPLGRKWPERSSP